MHECKPLRGGRPERYAVLHGATSGPEGIACVYDAARFGDAPGRGLAYIARHVIGCRSTTTVPSRGLHSFTLELKLSVGSGIEDMVSSSARPIRTVHFENPTDRPAESPTGSRSLSL